MLQKNPLDTYPPAISWPAIHTVLLDMDGTLLDLHFDNVFFRETVPQALAIHRGITLEEAKLFLHTTYQEIEGTLAWYDLDHWSRVLGIDILPLKQKIIHLLRVHPQSIGFLQALQDMGKVVHLVTNAHPASLALKLRHTPIGNYLTSVISSHELGHPKEDPVFWPLLHKKIGFDRRNTLLVDDSEPVLLAAEHYGIGHLRHIATPSSTQTANPSKHFNSVLDLGALLANDSNH